jgi:protein-disulfide isomerase
MYSMHRRTANSAVLTWLAALFVLGSAHAAAAQNAPSGGNTAAREIYQGIPVGFTADREPLRGESNAPVTLVEYSDLLCPFCERYFSQTQPTLLEKYVRNGQVKVILRDLPLASLHPNAPSGAAAAGCVAEQGAARFWAMYEALFQAQREWNRLADPNAFLAKLASQVGADTATYEACMASGRQ